MCTLPSRYDLRIWLRPTLLEFHSVKQYSFAYEILRFETLFLVIPPTHWLLLIYLLRHRLRKAPSVDIGSPGM